MKKSPTPQQLLLKSKHKRVVCIDATHICRSYHFPGGRVRRGQVYHVTGTDEKHDGLGFRILGKPIICEDGEGCWKAERFRVIP